MKVSESLITTFAGFGAVCVFLGGSVLLSGLNVFSLWGVLAFAFLFVGVFAVGYSLYLHPNDWTVIGTAALILIGGTASNIAYDFNARGSGGNSYSFELVGSDGSVYDASRKLFSIGGESLGSSCDVRFDARLKVTDPPNYLPPPSFTVDRQIFAKLDGSSTFGGYFQKVLRPDPPYTYPPGSPPSDDVHGPQFGWGHSSDGSVARCQTGSMFLETVVVSSFPPEFDEVSYCYSVVASVDLGSVGTVSSDPYDIHLKFDIRSGDLVFLGSGGGCPYD